MCVLLTHQSPTCQLLYLCVKCQKQSGKVFGQAATGISTSQENIWCLFKLQLKLSGIVIIYNQSRLMAL